MNKYRIFRLREGKWMLRCPDEPKHRDMVWFGGSVRLGKHWLGPSFYCESWREAIDAVIWRISMSREVSV